MSDESPRYVIEGGPMSQALLDSVAALARIQPTSFVCAKCGAGYFEPELRPGAACVECPDDACRGFVAVRGTTIEGTMP